MTMNQGIYEFVLFGSDTLENASVKLVQSNIIVKATDYQVARFGRGEKGVSD